MGALPHSEKRKKEAKKEKSKISLFIDWSRPIETWLN